MILKPQNYPFWGLCLSFCFGIYISYYLPNTLVIYTTLSLIIICSLILFYKKISNKILLLISSFLFVLLGSIRHQISNNQYEKNHISNIITTDNSSFQQATFYIYKKLKPSAKATKYYVNIKSINNKKVIGKALLSIKKSYNSKTYKIGDSFITYAKITPLKNSKNPYSFNYTQYLNNNDITHKIWLKQEQLHLINPIANKWNQLSFTIRNHLENNLNKQSLNNYTLQLTKALVLGNKSEIDNQLKEDFSNAGVIHILAISGLHIGIIYFILNGIFGMFFPFSKNNILVTISIIMLLWSFAWFTGGSPSAIRATTMFTCFQISKNLLRQQHPINALFLSILTLTLFNPNILFSVGFQLSVTAVASIIIGVPKLLSFWYPKNWFLNKIWSISCVSICAQVGVLPLSIYYFHQFPSLFLLANIPVMLVIVFLLISAITIVLTSSFFILPEIIIQAYNKFTLLIIDYINWIASFDNFIFTELYINKITLVICYFFGILLFLTSSSKKIIQCSFLIITLSLLIYFFEKTPLKINNELWLLNSYNNTIITEITSNKLRVFHSKKLTKNNINYLIKPINNSLHYNNYEEFLLQNIYSYNEHSIYRVNTNIRISNIKKGAIIILDESPKINIERLIIEQEPKVIIASANNYNYLLKKWKATCSSEQMAFYIVSESGALNLSQLVTSL